MPYYFGAYVEGVRCRFQKMLQDDEFRELMAEIGDHFPPAWFAWRVEQHESILNSERIQEISKLPRVTDLAGAPVDPRIEIRNYFRFARCGECGGSGSHPVYTSGRILEEFPIVDRIMCDVCMKLVEGVWIQE